MKRFSHCALALLLVALTLHTRAMAQEAESARQERATFGGYVHGGVNLHSANFQSLPGVPSCCPRYESGNGAGFDGGLFYRWVGLGIPLDLRIGYAGHGATLRTTESTTVLVEGVETPAAFRHQVISTLHVFEFTPLARFGVSNLLSLCVGPTIGFLASNSFSEEETLIQPSDRGTFENGRRTRNENAGETPGASRLYGAITGGVQARVPLHEGSPLAVRAEALYSLAFTTLARGMQWRADALRAGLVFEYTLRETPKPSFVQQEPVVTPPAPVTLSPAPQPPLTASLSALQLDTAGSETPIKELVIEDYIRTQYRPLLNFVFFDEGSTVLHPRYHQLQQSEASEFSMKRLQDFETLPLYYEVLNILGLRMQQYPKATITIVGCNADQGPEKGNRTLSRARAEAVASYFRTTWNIPENRIHIEIRNLPEKPSSTTEHDGQEENRRVEINSNMWQIVEPVLTTDTAHVPKPAVVRFEPASQSNVGLRSWELSTLESTGKLKEFAGKDSTPTRLLWELEKERESVLASLDTVQATLSVADRAGRLAEAPSITLPVRHYTLADKHREGSTDTIISRYSLILFDFDRGELSGANQRIADFVKKRIYPDSKVAILGYTDRIGSDDYNRELSTLRAHSTQRYLGLDKADVRGLGRSVLLYDNSLPEGRFYSRTVTVVVTTPLKR